MGPTASGKTSLAIELVQRLPCEIISVDSGMIYRGMDIGTAKPTRDELTKAPHRLIDICDPAESYSAGQFRVDAIVEITDILQQGRIPLLVGGTMLYFKVLQHGIAELPKANPVIRAKITQEAQEFGWEFLHAKLQNIDPVAAARISKADGQRIQRALELFELTGKGITELHQMQKAPAFPYKVCNLALAPLEKAWLHDRIKLRFQEMLKSGFIEEVEKLYQRKDLHPDLPSMRAVGYRQVWQYLSGEISYAEMCESIPIVTRQLAKRQLTWLRAWHAVCWFDCEDPQLVEKTAAHLRRSFHL